jgi:hypothetical protein
MRCHYHDYEATYRAIADALLRENEEILRLACASAWRAPRARRLTAFAVSDALNHLPLRSREHVCRLRLDPACSRSECRRAR